MNGRDVHMRPGRRILWVFAAGMIGLLAGLSLLGRPIDLFFYDTLTVYLPDHSPQNIMIVAIDEDSFAALGRQWPWPRNFHARLIKKLFEMGAKTVAVDILFPEPSIPFEDKIFADALNENVVLSASLESDDRQEAIQVRQVLPLPDFLAKGVRTGLDVLPMDEDGFLRKSRKRIGHMTAFALAAATSFLRASYGPAMVQEEARDPDEAWIRFFGPPGTLETISYYKALEPEKYKILNAFRDKLIFVGFSIRNTVSLTTAWADHYATPHARFGAGQMSGVEIQANIAANFINGKRIHSLPVMLCICAAMILSPAAAFFCLRMPVLPAGLACVVLACIPLACACLAFVHLSVFIPAAIFVLPVFFIWGAGLGVRYFVHLKEKQYIRNVFSHYLSASVVNYLLKHPEKLKPGGDFFRGTVLFLDIKNFSGMASRMPAETLIQILSRYLGRFSDIVLAHGGMMDKISGDAVMAVWGVPVPQKDHAQAACSAALEIDRECQRLQKEDESSGRPWVDIRIGINSGRLLAGNVRGKYFSDFTVHGVDVNLANRLETLNKQYGTRILIGEKTRSLLTEKFKTRRIDRLKPEGYRSFVTLYELLGLE